MPSSSLHSASLGGLSSAYAQPSGGADLQQLLQQMMQISGLQQVLNSQAQPALSAPSSGPTSRSSARNDPFSSLTAGLDALAGLPSNMHSSMSADLMAALVAALATGTNFSAPQPLPAASRDAAGSLPQLFAQSSSQRTPQKQERVAQQPSHAPVDLSKVTSRQHSSGSASSRPSAQASRPVPPAQSAAMPIDLSTRTPEKHSAFSEPNAGRHNVQVTLRHGGGGGGGGGTQSPQTSRQPSATASQRSSVGNVSVRLSHRPTGGNSPAVERSRPVESGSLKSNESPIDLSKKPGVHRAAVADDETGTGCASPAQKVPRQEVCEDKPNEEVLSLADEESSPPDFWERELDPPDDVLACIHAHEEELMAQVKTLQATDASDSQEARRAFISKLEDELRVEESQLLLVQRLKHMMRSQHADPRFSRASSAPAPEKRPSTPQVHVEFANGASSELQQQQQRHTSSSSLMNVSAASALSKSSASKTPEKTGKQVSSPVASTGHQRASATGSNTGGPLPGANSHAHTISSYSVLTKGPTTTPVQQPPQAHGGVTQSQSKSTSGAGTGSSTGSGTGTGTGSGSAAGAFNLTVSQKRGAESDATAASATSAVATSATAVGAHANAHASGSSTSSQSAAIQAQQLQQLQTQLTQGRSQLQRQFERNILALTPSSNTAAAPIASAPLRFVPSVTCADFVYLIGLEEVVSAIKNPEQSSALAASTEGSVLFC